MSKILTSPVKRWPGEVVLSDPLTFPQVFAVQDAFDAVKEIKRKTMERINFALLPAVLECVEEWHLEGFPEHPQIKDFPATPNDVRLDSINLIAWLVGEIGKLFSEAEEVPNE